MFDFGASGPLDLIPAYTLPVYASPCRLPDTTQDSVPGRWLGFTRAAISGGMCPLSFQGATLIEPDLWFSHIRLSDDSGPVKGEDVALGLDVA